MFYVFTCFWGEDIDCLIHYLILAGKLGRCVWTFLLLEEHCFYMGNIAIWDFLGLSIFILFERKTKRDVEAETEICIIHSFTPQMPGKVRSQRSGTASWSLCRWLGLNYLSYWFLPFRVHISRMLDQRWSLDLHQGNPKWGSGILCSILTTVAHCASLQMRFLSLKFCETIGLFVYLFLRVRGRERKTVGEREEKRINGAHFC